MFTDSHCHLYFKYYENIQKEIENAEVKGIKRFINCGCDTSSNKEVLQLSAKYPSMYCSLGIHPEEVLNYQEADLIFLENNLKNSKVIAIGEIGLDYHYNKETKIVQKELLEKQLLLAQKYKLPVIIHTRDAIQDTFEILKKYSLKGIIHSYSGSLEMADKFIKLGYKLGINGVVTFKNAAIKEVIKYLSLENIVLETDSPFLTPHPYRGRKNNPAFLFEIAAFIADLKGVSLEELAKVTSNNLKAIFDI